MNGRCGFTLTELLIVITIVLVLLGLTMPALTVALEVADRAACASNLRQIYLAAQVYLQHNDGEFFPLWKQEQGGRLWYFGYESSDSSQSQPEGSRILDKTRAALYPYLKNYETVEICPAFDYDSAQYKPKYEIKWWTYGVNLKLSFPLGSRNIQEVRSPRKTVLFADSAQVNTFQAPASPANPMVEEWFYVEPRNRYVHFRHGGLANVLFCDGRVAAFRPKAGSIDARLPKANVGYLSDEDVIFDPDK